MLPAGWCASLQLAKQAGKMVLLAKTKASRKLADRAKRFGAFCWLILIPGLLRDIKSGPGRVVGLF